MKKLYAALNQRVTIALMLLFSVGYSACFAQDELTNVQSKAALKEVEPSIFFQPVTSNRAPITNQASLKSNSLPFVQKFSQEKSTLSQQSTIQVQPFKQAELVHQQGSLLVAKSAHSVANSLASVSCGDTPVGTEDFYVTANDKVLTIAAPGFLANDNDLEGEPLTAILIVDNVDHGTLTAFGDGSFNYTPNPGFTGTDQFQYKMLDASGNPSDPVTVAIEVREAENRAPLGTNDDYGALSGTVLNIAAPGFLANDIDQDGDVITATLIADNVDHGLLAAFGDGSFVYTPNPGFTGTDQFQYKMQDSKGNPSEAVTVTIQVYEGNRNPLGTDDIFGVVQNTSVSIPAPGFLINDIDPDGDALAATLIADNADNGLLTAYGDGSFSYTPNSGFTGTDQFQYKMQDSKGNPSDAITVTLEVIASGVLPVGFPDTYQTADGSALSISAPGFLINDIDQNGEKLTATLIVDNVDHGSLTAYGDGSFVYTPTPGFTGTDQFQYQMQDASANQSDPVPVTIVVGESFNRAPTGIDDQYAALANTSLTIASPGFLANDVDQDGDVITATLIADNVDHGLLTAYGDGSFAYTPNPGFTGTDQFQYKMQDSKGNPSEVVTVNIVVYEGNRSPSGTNDVYAVVKDTPLNIAAGGFLVNDYDPDDDALTATVILDNVDHGSLTAYGDGSFQYTPEAGFTGTDSFEYKMQDSQGNPSDAVTVVLNVVGPNEPPIASAGNITAECSGPSGTTVVLDGSGSIDPEGGALTFTWYENNNLIAGPSSSPTSEVILSTGVHRVTMRVEDECGNMNSTDLSVNIEDTNGPLVETAFLPMNQANNFEISCSSEDVCSDVSASVSVIKIPDLINPGISFKNQSGYALSIDIVKNTVSVKAPNAAAFWTKILSNGGVIVNDGQKISAKYDKNKYKFSFDAAGNLISVEGEVVTLQCTATDGNGNSSVSLATLPPGMLKSGVISASASSDEIFTAFHRNYPNPFDRSTTIEYRLERPALVKISIFDQAGRLVEELQSKQMPEGSHKTTWDATAQKPGIYFYRIEYDGNQFSEKMILQR